MQDIPQVGGKNASLGEMLSGLSQLGIKVPNGFATTSDAYDRFIAHNKLDERLADLLDGIDGDNVARLQQQAVKIRQLILEGNFEPAFTDAVRAAYRTLVQSDEVTVAVRSSATAEDLPDASFAGQQETFLNVHGEDAVLTAIKGVYASLFNDRAIVYRQHHGFAHLEVKISAGIQLMVRSDKASSGVMFSIDPETGFSDVVFVTSSYGLGESIVQGSVNPDEFYVYKSNLTNKKPAVLRRRLGSKQQKMIYAKTGIQSVAVEADLSRRFSLTDEEVESLANDACLIEKHYGRPMDIEWAKDGITDELFIVQARPETVKSHESGAVIENYYLAPNQASPLVEGRSIGEKIGQGEVILLKSPEEMTLFKSGGVLVADMTDPDWEPVMKQASAIVTNRGGRTCHAAIIARELGIPAVVGTGDATETLKPGSQVTVSCAEGETGYVYPGKLSYEVKRVTLDKINKMPVKVMMNLGNPDMAYTYARLPAEGVGLARLEFIISNMIGIHPRALLSWSSLDEVTQDEIRQKTEAYGDEPTRFYVQKIVESVATIASAFQPHPIIVRMSDFKSNEYASLLGGMMFEPREENPMIGYRGASRYVSEEFRDCFKLECEAIKIVREQYGFENVAIMIPFVRTVAEAKAVKSLLSEFGLVSGGAGLKIYMMCELPVNSLLADEFLDIFDGFSIGSNDMTQLTLGLDRDSALIAAQFDERNGAVKALVEMAIKACKARHKYVGICGQAPSDYPEFADWLIELGIESMSLNPDTILPTFLRLT